MGKRKGLTQRVQQASADGRESAYREALDPRVRNATSGTAMDLTLDRIELSPNNYRLLEQEGVTRGLFAELRREALEVLDSEHRQAVVGDEYVDQRERGQTDDDEFLDRVEALAGQRGESLSQSARERVESIIGMARTIVRHSLLQPIVVHPPESREAPYVVHYGNRRTLACILLGRHKVSVHLRHASEDPYNEAAAGLVENITREDLVLSERLRALHDLDHLHREKTGKELDVHEIRRTFGLGRAMAYRYHKILRAPQGLQNAILAGDIRSFNEALQGMHGGDEFPDPGGEDGEDTAAGSGAMPMQPTTGSQSRGRGRAPKAVQLGKTTDTTAVYRLMSGVLGEDKLAERFPDVDWADFSSVKKAWGQFLQELEGQR